MQVSWKTMEEELIKGCSENDRLSQKRLYERYYGKLMGVCMRYASDTDQAMEILNTGFLKIFNTIKDFDKSGGNFEGWMYRIMVNCSLDHIRREIRHRHSEEDKILFREDASDVLADLAAEEILALINQLSPAYRAVFNLYVVEGYSHPEIGKLLGISEGTSKSNLAKARAKLQTMVRQSHQINLGAYGKQ